MNNLFPEFSIIRMKIDNTYNLKEKDNALLYHYTDLDGFMSIMRNRDFWISNIRFMNDSQEFENGKRICVGILKDRLLRCNTEYETKFYNEILKICDEKISRGHFGICNQEIYALSFCGQGDLLTQWQVYGNKGISIGFKNKTGSFDALTFMNEEEYLASVPDDPKQMLPHNELRVFCDKIVYDDSNKKSILNDILDIGVDFIKEYGISIIDLCCKGISDALFYYFALMKASCFQHEDERRFLYTFNDKININFRKRGDILLPYIKMKILDVNCRPHDYFPIEDIVIAPGKQNEYVAESVRFFLDKSGYPYLIDKVRTSEIPYRG